MRYTPPKRRKLTKAERQEVYDKCGGHCAYCGCEFAYKDMQVDHVQPISVNGEDVMENYLPACRGCNHYKGAFGLEGYRTWLEKALSRLERDSVTYKNAVRYGLVLPNPKPVVFYFEREEV